MAKNSHWISRRALQMIDHNLHMIGLIFSGEEEEEALRDPEATGGKQRILPCPGSKWEKDERKWAEGKPGGQAWRASLEGKPGGQAWRASLEGKPGGQAWRKSTHIHETATVLPERQK